MDLSSGIDDYLHSNPSSFPPINNETFLLAIQNTNQSEIGEALEELNSFESIERIDSRFNVLYKIAVIGLGYLYLFRG